MMYELFRYVPRCVVRSLAGMFAPVYDYSIAASHHGIGCASPQSK